jgi:hypothetical protein
MLKEQRAYWKGLRWYEKAMVLSTLIPGTKVFLMYLKTLVLVVRLMVLV